MGLWKFLKVVFVRWPQSHPFAENTKGWAAQPPRLGGWFTSSEPPNL
jgi:hypothetical protein